MTAGAAFNSSTTCGRAGTGRLGEQRDAGRSSVTSYKLDRGLVGGRVLFSRILSLSYSHSLLVEQAVFHWLFGLVWGWVEVRRRR